MHQETQGLCVPFPAQGDDQRLRCHGQAEEQGVHLEYFFRHSQHNDRIAGKMRDGKAIDRHLHQRRHTERTGPYHTPAEDRKAILPLPPPYKAERILFPEEPGADQENEQRLAAHRGDRDSPDAPPAREKDREHDVQHNLRDIREGGQLFPAV